MRVLENTPSRWTASSYEEVMKYKTNLDNASEKLQQEIEDDSRHSITFQHMLIFQKCPDPKTCPTNMCKHYRSQKMLELHTSFNNQIPQPIPSPSDSTKFQTSSQLAKNLHFCKPDEHCPTVKESYSERVCSKCNYYCASVELLELHKNKFCCFWSGSTS